MVRRGAGLILLALLALAACGQDQAPIPTTTPTFTPTTVVTPTATTPPATPTSDPNELPSFEQIRSEYARLRPQKYGDSTEALQNYINSLKGKKIKGRDVWVFYEPFTDRDGKYFVRAYGEDPYSPAELAKVRYEPESHIINLALTAFPADLLPLLGHGTKLRFDGEFTDLETTFYGGEIVVRLTKVEIVEGAATPTAITTTAIPLATPTIDAAPTADGTVVQSDVTANITQLKGGDLVKYLVGLNGKRAEGWRAWIISSENYFWQITLTDPFSSQIPAALEYYDMYDFSDPFYYALGSNNSGTELRFGQELLVSGVIRADSNGMTITEAQIEPRTNKLDALKAPADLTNLVMTMERTRCYGTCPIYRVTVYGNGTVVWYGRSYVAARGTWISIASEDTVRALLAEYLKADYFNLANEYKEYNASDSPDINTALVYKGKSKSIKHYGGDLGTPARLQLLEQRFDELIDTQRFIGRN